MAQKNLERRREADAKLVEFYVGDCHRATQIFRLRIRWTIPLGTSFVNCSGPDYCSKELDTLNNSQTLWQSCQTTLRLSPCSRCSATVVRSYRHNMESYKKVEHHLILAFTRDSRGLYSSHSPMPWGEPSETLLRYLPAR